MLILLFAFIISLVMFLFGLDEFDYDFYVDIVGSIILVPFLFIFFGSFLGLFHLSFAWYVTWMTGSIPGAFLMFFIFYVFPSLKQKVAFVAAISGMALIGTILLIEQGNVEDLFLGIIFSFILGFALGTRFEYIAKRRDWYKTLPPNGNQ